MAVSEVARRAPRVADVILAVPPAANKSREGGAGAAKPTPAGAGRAVTDPKLLEEFEKQVKKGR